MNAEVAMARYPKPPSAIIFQDDDSDILLTCWNKACQREQSIPQWGYFFISVFQEKYRAEGNFQRSAQVHGVEQKILDTFKNLTTEHGGKEARKKSGKNKPLTPAERAWLLAAMRELLKRFLQRVGRRGKTFSRLTMDDLSDLN